MENDFEPSVLHLASTQRSLVFQNKDTYYTKSSELPHPANAIISLFKVNRLENRPLVLSFNQHISTVTTTLVN